jgi:hypothetical protein
VVAQGGNAAEPAVRRDGRTKASAAARLARSNAAATVGSRAVLRGRAVRSGSSGPLSQGSS